MCLEAQTLAKKRFSFKVFFIAPYSLFSNKSIHSRYLFVMTCIVTGQSQLCGALTFSSIIYLAGEKNNQSFQDIRLRPAVHKLSVSTFI